MTKLHCIVAAVTTALLVSACGEPEGVAGHRGGEAPHEAGDSEDALPKLPNPDPFPSTYRPYPSKTTAIVGATIYDGAGGRYEDGVVLMSDGKIEAVGAAGNVVIPVGAAAIDAAGKYVSPGIIDIHSHLGNYPSPSAPSTADGNEMTSPNTAGVWTEHSVWPQDAGFTRALAGGVTVLQILPGSANLFGGRSVILKNVPARSVQAMKFPGAPYGLKMACGENPKRAYAERSGPATRMGSFFGYRSAWIDAADYRKQWQNYAEQFEHWEKEGGEEPDPPKRDLQLESLAGVLAGDIAVNIHCYRADEMVQVLDVAKEFGFDVASFHHAVEAYKIADILAARSVCVAMWADWWGFKMEAYDGIRENIALVHAQADGCAIVHSDSPLGIQRLNQEAAKAMADGNLIGLEIAPETAMTWLSLNPAKAMGIADRVGSLETGKMADVVVWSGDPFSVYSLVEQVYIDGALMYDRNETALSPQVDFELGQALHDDTGGAKQ